MSNDEIERQVASDLGLSDAVLRIVAPNRKESRFAYDASWARSNLKQAGLVENVGRCLWAVTESGLDVDEEQEVLDKYKRTKRAYRRSSSEPSPVSSRHYGPADALEDLFISPARLERMLDALRSRKNLILQGPPGTGKTFMARRLAWCLIETRDSKPIEMVQFHQSYAYEDFVQGYRPTARGGFTLRNGVFFEFCKRARDAPETPHVLIIDEINRGNLSRIFGELLMLVESDKRSEEYAVSLTYGKPGDSFFVPPNVHILGLMNTADRSLAVVDYALRRRFAFERLSPAFGTAQFRAYLRKCGVDTDLVQTIQRRMERLNREIREDSDLGPGFEIGHSYFVPAEGGPVPDNWYEDIVRTQIVPMLREYWFDAGENADNAAKALRAP